jgi:putative phosphoribosyl transferase
MTVEKERPKRFRDRLHAGAELAEELRRHLWDQETAVLAIPPDGVPIAASIAVALQAPLDLVAAQRIVAPQEPGMTLGAITPDRTLVLNRELVGSLGLGDADIDSLSLPAWTEAQRCLSRYRGSRGQIDVRGKTVVIVDDGITSGYTMLAAVIASRRLEPARIMVAVPVGTLEAIERLSGAADDVLTLEMSMEPDFSVHDFYSEYEPLEDREVLWTLDHIWRERPPGGSGEMF